MEKRTSGLFCLQTIFIGYKHYTLLQIYIFMITLIIRNFRKVLAQLAKHPQTLETRANSPKTFVYKTKRKCLRMIQNT